MPYLGICLGMQVAVIEFARNVLGIADADSGEFDRNSANKVIDFLPDQSDSTDKGGTLRLGSYPCKTADGSLLQNCYGEKLIHERHRHRYEFNNDYRRQMEAAGMVLSGTSPDDYIVEAVELPKNDFFIGVQYHPEFKSRPNKPAPLFVGLVKRRLNGKENKQK